MLKIEGWPWPKVGGPTEHLIRGWGGRNQLSHKPAFPSSWLSVKSPLAAPLSAQGPQPQRPPLREGEQARPGGRLPQRAPRASRLRFQRRHGVCLCFQHLRTPRLASALS